VHREPAELLAIPELQATADGTAQCVRLLHYRLEYRCEVARRGVDDLQYLGGRGLLLQRLSRLGEEPRVLHCDDRLRCEILKQCDLFLGKRPHLRAEDQINSYQHTLFSQRDGGSRPRAAKLNQGAPLRVAR